MQELPCRFMLSFAVRGNRHPSFLSPGRARLTIKNPQDSTGTHVYVANANAMEIEGATIVLTDALILAGTTGKQLAVLSSHPGYYK
ncbi:hypothetical protein [Flavihumibacter sp. UBA7668]|uniref:hypothetical protein n=1 Tax=Flavihumibacter sp. UBA7668 TaxID=1946542 RepID=UPI0025BADE68|nr:hypothetical protein [Flavihumibacter sp. UBA7668]